MSKEVGIVTGKQFGYLYISGLPYNFSKVHRFMDKGLGVKLQDTVVYEFELRNGERVLTYLKNGLYADAKENAMIRDFVTANELKKQGESELEKQVRKELAEEGIDLPEDTKFTPDGKVDCTSDRVYEKDFKPEELKLLTNDQRRQLAILLQSSLKIALEKNDITDSVWDFDEVLEDTITITRWIDRNSTQILKV